ncbi:hypothetical protein D9613_002019 [Agrocybe pediades]|uniref:Dihydroorotate oxidase n=1 Tax=Agrocybe pediades TaxID=84607 RepID=A0A8H4VXV8_9AGAR|nr:hypothetical protein D9613_002019 [Agrocybe pediades]
MVTVNTIQVDPALINSSCAWSSSLQQLLELYESPYTGAITTRTATQDGFPENDIHTVVFHAGMTTTLNSYGYSPHPLSQYLVWVEDILKTHPSNKKPVIISITASEPLTLALMIQAVQDLRKRLRDDVNSTSQIAVELNTSCPNIPKAAPSGYLIKSLKPLIQSLADAHAADPTLTIGLKLPPYVYKDQFTEVVEVLQSLDVEARTSGSGRCPISFLTCTNTLGNSLLFAEETTSSATDGFALPTDTGGLAGQSLHPLALGNVYTFKELLTSSADDYPGLKGVKIIGVGGVTDKAALRRMQNAGADVVGCATLFGKEGVQAFEMLSRE